MRKGKRKERRTDCKGSASGGCYHIRWTSIKQMRKETAEALVYSGQHFQHTRILFGDPVDKLVLFWWRSPRLTLVNMGKILVTTTRRNESTTDNTKRQWTANSQVIHANVYHYWRRRKRLLWHICLWFYPELLLQPILDITNTLGQRLQQPEA